MAKFRALLVAKCATFRSIIRQGLIPESEKFLLVKSGIPGFGIWNSVQGIWDRANDWNPESTAWNSESKTVLDYLGKLPTYPSPKPTLSPTSHLGQNIGLGEE